MDIGIRADSDEEYMEKCEQEILRLRAGAQDDAGISARLQRLQVSATELEFYAAAAFERKSLKMLMTLLEEGRLDVRLKPGGNSVCVDDYEWKVREKE